jgi:hypothetical protein
LRKQAPGRLIAVITQRIWSLGTGATVLIIQVVDVNPYQPVAPSMALFNLVVHVPAVHRLGTD